MNTQSRYKEPHNFDKKYGTHKIDRDPHDIEYQKMKDECTFQPNFVQRPKEKSPKIQDFLDIEPKFSPKAPKDFKPKTFRSAQLAVVDEPICILRVELDGNRIEEVKIFEGETPEQVVQQFSAKFNLSKNGQKRLLAQVQDELDI